MVIYIKIKNLRDNWLKDTNRWFTEAKTTPSLYWTDNLSIPLWSLIISKHVYNWAPNFVSQICFTPPVVFPSNFRLTTLFLKPRPQTVELFITLLFLLYTISYSLISTIQYKYIWWDHIYHNDISSFTYSTKIASYQSPWFRHYVLQYIFHKVAKGILLKLKAKQKLFTWMKCSLGENAKLEERLTSLQWPQIPTWSIYHCSFRVQWSLYSYHMGHVLFLKHSGQTIAKGCTLFLFSGFQHPSLSICFINPSIPSSLYLNITFRVGLSYPSYLYFNPPPILYFLP